MSEPPPRLTRFELAISIALALGVFLLYQGPFWRHRWQIDASIWYSYLVIPVIVALVLVRGRKFAVGEFALATLEVTCWKFGITYLVAHTLWMLSPPPPHRPAVIASFPDAPPSPDAGRPVVPEQTGSIDGTIRDERGLEVQDAVAFIEEGLEGYVFAPTHSDAVVAVRTGSIEPSISVAELHQEVRAHSTDGKLHTLVARWNDSDLFNLPLQSSGAFAVSELRRGRGMATLRCTVHERSTEVARLLVLAHPFHTLVDEGSRFDWNGVPSGRVSVVAIHPDGRSARAEVEVMAQTRASVSLVLRTDSATPK